MMNNNNYGEDFGNIFNDIFGQTINNKTQNKINECRSLEEELDSMFKEYNDFVQDLKNDGYKILRTDAGRHKVVKEA